MERSLPAGNSTKLSINFLVINLSFLKAILAKIYRVCLEVKPREAFGYYFLTLINLGTDPILMSVNGGTEATIPIKEEKYNANSSKHKCVRNCGLI